MFKQKVKYNNPSQADYCLNGRYIIQKIRKDKHVPKGLINGSKMGRKQKMTLPLPVGVGLILILILSLSR